MQANLNRLYVFHWIVACFDTHHTSTFLTYLYHSISSLLSFKLHWILRIKLSDIPQEEFVMVTDLGADKAHPSHKLNAISV